jgi:hypothetical protein
MKNAIRVAAELAERGITLAIERGLATLHPIAMNEAVTHSK